MAKRFTDSNKYKKPFFRRLPGAYKLFWDFLYHDCDHTGIWIVDFQIAQLYLGKDVDIDKETALRLFNEDEQRVVIIEDGKKWFLPTFISFQYGNQLVSKNRMHMPIINTIERYDLIKYLDVVVLDEGTTLNAFRGRITKKVKEEILLRDGFKCQYCSNQYSFEELVVDHIIPLTKGGNNENKNLAACCVRCNSYKSDILIDDFLKKKHEFLKPTDFIIKMLEAPYKTLEAPYNKLEDPKDKDMDKDMDDSFKDGGMGEEKQEKMLCPEMVGIFRKAYPSYPIDSLVDYSACIEIAYKSAELKNWTKQSVTNGKMDEMLKYWEEIVLFSKTDSWYSTRSISDFNKEFQRLIQKFSNGNKPNQGKQSGQYARPVIDTNVTSSGDFR